MERHEIEQALKNEIKIINHCDDSVEIDAEAKLKEILDSVDILQFVYKVNKNYNLSFGSSIGDEKYLDTLDSVVFWVHSAINKKGQG